MDQLGPTPARRTTTDELLALLADSCRRRVLEVLLDANPDGRLTLEELSTRVDDETVGDETLCALTVALHHRHLPKLAEAGLVEYDPDTRTVEPVVGRAGRLER